MSAKIEDLEPVTRAACERVLAACAADATITAAGGVRVTHTRRTLDEQLHLWRQGREFRGGRWYVVDEKRVVTKARPGMSAHNYGAAWDICFNGKNPYLDGWKGASPIPGAHPAWAAYGEIVEAEAGFSWGGPRGPNDDLTWDMPHAQRRDWRKLRGAA